MSSFKRKISQKQAALLPGTRLSPGSSATTITSTGIPSLDDILGGGLPLSCSLLVLAPDVHSAYGELVQKYFISQGVAAAHKVCIVDDHARDVLVECMWTPNGSAPAPAVPEDEDEDERAGEQDAKIKIAWRYQQMKQFRTTVSAPTKTSMLSAEEYCRVFDLTARLPSSVVDSAVSAGLAVFQNVRNSDEKATLVVLKNIAQMLAEDASSESPQRPIRICVPSLGSSQWGDVSPPDICYFLHSLRALLRGHPHACASIALPPHLCTDSWGGPGWVQKLSWLTDGCISLAAFSANPSLAALFSAHHGLVHTHGLPAPHGLLAASDRFSALRGLSASGENNLAFKCMRRRLVFEMLHLDLEGGVGERRTAPAPGVSAVAAEHLAHGDAVVSTGKASGGLGGAGAAVEVELEEIAQGGAATLDPGERAGVGSEGAGSAKKGKGKAKKKVAFHSDRPDLYDF